MSPSGEPYGLTDRTLSEERSSRADPRRAGWSPTGDGGWSWVNRPGAHGAWETRLDERVDARWRDFSWLSSTALLDSANDQIAKLINDLVGPRRKMWMAAQRAACVDERFPDLRVTDRTSSRKLLILGDPGEADGSQYAVIDPMLAVHDELGSDFMVVLSDVIYPSGEVNDYVNGFYIPFKEYDKPIFGLPGNHDWYDGLNGFMRTFCGSEPLPPTEYRRSSFTATERVASRLWRKASRPNRTRLLRHRSALEVNQSNGGPPGAWLPDQPGPYFAIDMAGVRIVAIDTGIGGKIDTEQAEWLIRMSRTDERIPKVLLTGKPLWVDGEYKPTTIEWEPGDVIPHGYDTVDDVVLDPANNYVAAIGGDTHNYQRYTVTVDDGPHAPGAPARRRIEYVVSGGAGAYMSATHRIPKINHQTRDDAIARARRRRKVSDDGHYGAVEYAPPEKVLPVGESQFRCYPTRADSLAFYARVFGQRLFRACLALAVLTAAALGLLAAWALMYDELGEQTLPEVFGVAFFGPLLAIGAIAAVVALSRIKAGRGYYTVSLLLVLPVAIAATVIGLVALRSDLDWIWQVVLLTFATIALPLALIVFAHYGLTATTPGSGGRMPRQLALSVLLVAEVLIWLPFDWYEDQTGLIVIVLAAPIATLLVLRLVSHASDPIGGWFEKRDSRLIGWAAALAYLALIAAPIVRFREEWAVQVTLVSAATFLVWATLALFIWILVNKGARALFGRHLARGRVDPNKAARYVRDKYCSDEVTDARLGSPIDKAANAIGDFLIADVDPDKPHKRKSINSFISEAGNSDTPPMFKNFMHLEVDENGKWLEVRCYGVTGWRDHEGPADSVPIEDHFKIDLAPELVVLETIEFDAVLAAILGVPQVTTHADAAAGLAALAGLPAPNDPDCQRLLAEMVVALQRRVVESDGPFDPATLVQYAVAFALVTAGPAAVEAALEELGSDFLEAPIRDALHLAIITFLENVS